MVEWSYLNKVRTTWCERGVRPHSLSREVENKLEALAGTKFPRRGNIFPGAKGLQIKLITFYICIIAFTIDKISGIQLR